MVFVVGGAPEPPLGREDRRAYQEQLKHLLAGAYPAKRGQNIDKLWERRQAKATAQVDDEGRPVLQMQVGENLVRMGTSAGNILSGGAPPELVRQLLEARLQAELRRKPAMGISESEVARDWKLIQQTMIQQTMGQSNSGLSARSARSETFHGNKP
jgi:hypothetical protein